MAQQRNQTAGDKYCCSICLDLLKDPVTIPCGHNYCMKCIKTHWDVEDQKKIYSCPQCRQTVRSRPVLMFNTMLAELVEEQQKAEDVSADHSYVKPGDVSCDDCTGRKMKALKSCLVCRASFCEKHLQPHYDSLTFRKHRLVEATVKLQETLCPRHDEVMKIFCRTDQQCICYLCLMDEHKGHDTISAAAERTEKQKELGESQKKIQQRIKIDEEDMKVLQQEMDKTNSSADKAVADSEKTFTELIRMIERRRLAVTQNIRSRQRAEVNRVKELQQKTNQRITELKRKDAEMEQLSHTEDHGQFLLNYPSLPQFTEFSPRPNVNHLQYFEKTMAAVTAAGGEIKDILTGKWALIEPATRAEVLEYSREITLDPNTVNRRLVLSEGNRKIIYDEKNNPYSNHPDRFKAIPQVLSKDGLTGRCYWEVEISKHAAVAVAYKSIQRSGDVNACVFGDNKSWVLWCRDNYVFRHDNNPTYISAPRSSRVGVYLDHRAGILSFYSVSETMTLLHRVQTTFTEPLYAGLYLCGSNGDTVEMCNLKPLLKRKRTC